MISKCALLFILLLGPVNSLPRNVDSPMEYFSYLFEEASVKAVELGQALEDLRPGLLDGKSDKIVSALQELSECDTCMAAIAFFKLISGPEWDNETLGNWTNVCHVLLKTLDNETRTDIMCPGIMAIQGPHAHKLLIHESTAVTPAEACESLNGCIPPETTPRVKPALKKQSIWSDKLNRIPSHMLREFGRRRQHFRRERSVARPKAGPVRIAQLTDIHIDERYDENGPTECNVYVCCRNDYGGTGSARPWGEYSCNIPERTMHLFIDRILEMNPRPDYVIYSGDTPPHHMWEETFDSQLSCTSKIAAAFKDKLSPVGIRVLPAIGNHEMYPTNLFFKDMSETQNFISRFLQHWRDVANFSSENEQTITNGGYYSLLLQPGLRLLVFNTNYMYNLNFYNVWNKNRVEVQEMYTFMETTMSQARLNGEKVVLVGHHPTGRPDSIVTPSRWFRDFAVQYGDIISMHVAGHTHNNEYKVVVSPIDGLPKHVEYVAPSGTALPYINPSMRVFVLDETSHALSDYEQYYFDLKTANNVQQPPALVLSHSAKTEYSLTDLSPQSWYDLIGRFHSDDALFQKYYFNYHSRVETEFDCDESCKTSMLCGLRHAVYDKYLECINATNGYLDNHHTEAQNVVDSGFRSAPFSLLIFAVVAITGYLEM